jgi:acyl-homoserine-lactone acylase
MHLRLLLLALLCAACSSSQPPASDTAAAREVAAWREQARDVTIVRDDWGIPHVRGKTDADAVFGLMYAQAEDDFNRIERNFLLSQGRLAEAEGEKEIWRDLRMRLFIDPSEMQRAYEASPAWLRKLMDAWAAGLNFYLATHPDVKPLVLTRFEPWMALTFSEGSIGGDIERVSLDDLRAFYEQPAAAPQTRTANLSGLAPAEPTGSNGFAIAPSRSASKRALLWINPHTSFFFRTEAQVTSEEGLNAYGALTWGQFFVYQGFNEHAGWMHTSSGVDNIDEYLLTVSRRGEGYTYKYGDEARALHSRKVVVRYKSGESYQAREFTVYRSHHGPVVRRVGDRWVSVRLMEEPLKALQQSYLRTKARSLADFMKVMELYANSSNNTVFADAGGAIAYLHANYVPRRDPKLDWTKPVDGSDPATDWRGLHTIAEAPNVINPQGGWLFNTNNAPWTAAGADSPEEKNYPAYFDGAGENPRGVHAIRVLSAQETFTPDSLIKAAFDPALPALETLVPTLLAAHRALPGSDGRKAKLAEPIATLEAWDYRWSADSIGATLGVLWADELWRLTEKPGRDNATAYADVNERASARQRIDAFTAVIDRLSRDFDTWRVAWGELNRFQRLTGDIEQPFADDKPSIPVPFATGRWGSLATFGTRTPKGSKKLYGVSGNSFLAVVEFGDRVKARAITVGGQSSDPESPHFNDQAERYARGDLREVYFYPEQLAGHTERVYAPGEATE